MSIVAQHVREFKRVTKQPPSRVMSERLVKEEFQEWLKGTPITEPGKYPHSKEAELKELADLVYVIYGYADTMGWDLDIAINRVHKNNLARVIQDDGTVKFREDGKALKNPNAPKVSLSDLV